VQNQYRLLSDEHSDVLTRMDALKGGRIKPHDGETCQSLQLQLDAAASTISDLRGTVDGLQKHVDALKKVLLHSRACGGALIQVKSLTVLEQRT
jgi:hypothetical protein